MAPCGTPEVKRRSKGIFFRSPTRSLKIDTTPEKSSRQDKKSLGTGRLSPDGSVSFTPSPRNATKLEIDRRDSSPAVMGKASSTARATKLFADPPKFLRRKSSFLRVADLDMDATSCSTLNSDEAYPNFHHPAVDPPPGVAHDPKEKWIALNDGDGSHAPIAPAAVERLAHFGLTTSMNHSMWNPDNKTDKALKKSQCPEWMKGTFKPGCVRLPLRETPEHGEVFIWSGNFKHGLYGSDLPAIRAAGIVNMSAKALMDLLVDSSRVKEYNKLSLGRDDLVTFQESMESEGPFGCSITKVMKSVTKPPLIRKTLVFVSILHAKHLIDGSGYLVVTRAVHHPEEEGLSNVIKSEILMGVNLIRKIEGAEDSRCLMINVNHIRSPMIPMMIAKRIGVSAAVGFVNDIRAVC
jgi:hypothetical protein